MITFPVIFCAAAIGTSRIGVCITPPNWMPNTVAASDYVGAVASMSNCELRAANAASLVSLRDALHERVMFTRPHANGVDDPIYYPATESECKTLELTDEGDWSIAVTSRNYQSSGKFTNRSLDARLIRGDSESPDDSPLIDGAEAIAGEDSFAFHNMSAIWSSSVLDAYCTAQMPESEWVDSKFEAAGNLVDAIPTLRDIQNDSGESGWGYDLEGYGVFANFTYDFAGGQGDWDALCHDREEYGLFPDFSYDGLRAAMVGCKVDELPDYKPYDGSLRQSPLVKAVPMLAAKDVVYYRELSDYTGRGTFDTEAVDARYTITYSGGSTNVEIALGEQLSFGNPETVVTNYPLSGISADEYRGSANANTDGYIEFSQAWGIPKSKVETKVQEMIDEGIDRCWLTFDIVSNDTRMVMAVGTKTIEDGIETPWFEKNWFSHVDGTTKMKGSLAYSAWLGASVDYKTTLTNSVNNYHNRFDEHDQQCIPCGGAANAIDTVTGIAMFHTIVQTNFPEAVTWLYADEKFKLSSSDAIGAQGKDLGYFLYKDARGYLKTRVDEISGFGDSTPSDVAQAVAQTAAAQSAFNRVKSDINVLKGTMKIEVATGTAVFIQTTEPYIRTDFGPVSPDEDGMYPLGMATIRYDSPYADTISGITKQTRGVLYTEAMMKKVKFKWRNLPIDGTATSEPPTAGESDGPMSGSMIHFNTND